MSAENKPAIMRDLWGYTPEQLAYIKRREEILNKIVNGPDKYFTNGLWHSVIDAMAKGGDPLFIIEQLIDINIAQAEQLERKVLAEPMMVSIAQPAIIHKGLEWQPVDPEKLPVGEVLARNQDYVLLGLLNISEYPNEAVTCCMENIRPVVQLGNITHYITIENLLKL
jgi:hypothetical protein